MASPRIEMEYAKSARSTCKHCGNAVAKGELRLGTVRKGAGGFDMVGWHHPHCFFTVHPLDDSDGAFELEESTGYSLLKQSDQLHLKHLMASASKDHTQSSPKRSKKAEEDCAASPKAGQKQKPSLVMEYAKSSRSACKHCGNAVAKGELRLGNVSTGPGGCDMVGWHHPHCFFTAHRLDDSDGAFDLEKSTGYSLLKQSDQLHLKHLMANASKDNIQRSPKRSKKAEEDDAASPKAGQKLKPSLVMEYAKSSRSACKHCGNAVAKGELRLGTVSTGPGGCDMVGWHHPHCFFTAHPLDDSDGAFDLEESTGYSLLKQSDQSHLKHLMANASKGHTQRSPKRSKKDEEDGAASPKAGQKLTLASHDSKGWERLLHSFTVSQLSDAYKGAALPSGWKAYSSVIYGKVNVSLSSDRVAAFDFDGCLVKTSVQRVGAHAWSLLYPSVPQKLRQYHGEGYKLVIFTNESNIDRWKNSRQKAIDSKLGRLEAFMELVEAPLQVFVACAKEADADPCRKPATGMWDLMERHFNDGIRIERSNSLYVGDAAGRAGDHSDADLGFAKAIGLPFRVPEEVFKN